MDAQGFRGGIWLFWRKEVVTVRVLDAHTQHVTVEISKNGVSPWIFSVVYASPASTLRRDLWSALEEVKRNFDGPGSWGVISMTLLIWKRGLGEVERKCSVDVAILQTG